MPFLAPGNLTFRGIVEIDLDCAVTAANVTLHAKRLEIDEDSVVLTDAESGEAVEIVSHEYDDAREFYVLNLKDKVEKGRNYTLYIEYSGLITKETDGIYQSPYKNQEGKEV